MTFESVKVFIDERFVGSAKTPDEVFALVKGYNCVFSEYRKGGREDHWYTHRGREIFRKGICA